jgi:hypothetical protein
MTRLRAIEGLDARSYPRHALHGENNDWPEKNCYADVWIELLHALQLEPLAMLGHTLAVDFEGDQWTFFKPSHTELRELYGVDVQELTVWRPLIEHVVEHLGAGKLVSSEVDAYWLPDTAGTDYRTKHTKTTILIADLDTQQRRVGYFHNAGYFEASGEDYAQLFRIDAEKDPSYMPLFAELVRIERRVKRPPAQLADRAVAMLRRHVDWRPQTNPFTRFADRFARDMPGMHTAGLDHYHAWAFASVRQAGAAFELAAAHLRWLATFAIPQLAAAAENFQAISQGNKALILKGARAAHTGKRFDPAALVSEMASAWDEGMAVLERCLHEQGR